MEVLQQPSHQAAQPPVPTHPPLPHGPESPQGTDTPILDILVLLSGARRRIALATLSALILGALTAFSLTPTFSAKATIMPPQAPQSSLSSLMGQLGSLSALGGGGAGSLLKNPADLYVGILQSRTVADFIIERFHLQTVWHTKTMEEARKALATHVQFEAAKDGLIEISAHDKDPRLVSDLANSFVDALNGMNARLAISEASQRRLFFDQQLEEEKNALVVAENDLKTTQQKTGLLSLTGQAELAVRSVAQTRAQISSKQVELQSLRAFDAEENPDVIRLKSEIATMQGQLTELENNEQRQAPGDTQIAANQVPAGSLEYERKLREVKYHTTLLDLLSRQFEAARIDEAKSAPIIQVVDRAVVPDKKSGPPRLLIILGATTIGFLLACAAVIASGALRRARQTSSIAAKLNTHFPGREFDPRLVQISTTLSQRILNESEANLEEQLACARVPARPCLPWIVQEWTSKKPENRWPHPSAPPDV